MPLKPQDFLVCLELTTRDQESWTYAELAEGLGLSPSETNKAVERGLEADILIPPADPKGKPGPVRASLLEFLAQGVRYAFFVSPGRLVRGMPTAHSAPPLDAQLRGADEPRLVWPDPEGEHRGQAVDPLYSTFHISAARTRLTSGIVIAHIDAPRFLKT